MRILHSVTSFVLSITCLYVAADPVKFDLSIWTKKPCQYKYESKQYENNELTFRQTRTINTEIVKNGTTTTVLFKTSRGTKYLASSIDPMQPSILDVFIDDFLEKHPMGLVFQQSDEVQFNIEDILKYVDTFNVDFVAKHPTEQLVQTVKAQSFKAMIRANCTTLMGLFANGMVFSTNYSTGKHRYTYSESSPIREAVFTLDKTETGYHLSGDANINQPPTVNNAKAKYVFNFSLDLDSLESMSMEINLPDINRKTVSTLHN